MHYSNLVLPLLATLSLASAAVIPPPGGARAVAPMSPDLLPIPTTSRSTGTSLSHCMELLQAHNDDGNPAVPTVADADAEITRCGRCLNTADLACGQKGYTKPEEITDRLMQCYVNFWPKSKCA